MPFRVPVQDEVALGSNACRLVGFPRAVADFRGVEDVVFGAFDLLVDLFFLKFRVLGFVEGGGFLSGGLFGVKRYIDR
jgi:hypothetical protein